MKFFIDTANLEQIQEAYDLGVLEVSKERRISVNIISRYVRLSTEMSVPK